MEEEKITSQREIENGKSEIRLPIFLAIAIATGIFIGASFVKPSVNSEGLGSNLSKFKEVLVSIDNNYVDEVNSDEMTDQAIRQMLRELDPHSNYIPSEEVARLNAQIEGSYDGIGIQFDIIRDTVYVVKPLKGGPSIDAGLRIGDKIIRVEGENIAGINIDTRGVTDRLLGSAGSSVNITILRNQDEIDFTIKRGTIPQRSIESYYMINDESGYIRIARFGSKTYEEFLEALTDLKSRGMKKLILDLQGNPGGLMSAAEKISDEFLPEGKLIVDQKSIHDRYNASTFSTSGGLFEEGPLILLVNENSASASEIVSGAMQDHDRALIVGRRTFGKGLVQMPITLNDRSELRLTIARYYTPSGRSIQKPYSNGEDYYGDINSRYVHGEFFNADSIKFEDSLKYETEKGRPVYGGGGIMPDYFVPFDTSMNTAYDNRLSNSRAIREFSINYFIGHEKQISEMDLEGFRDNFHVSDEMLNEIVRIGESLGVKYNPDEFSISKSLLKSKIKAEICSLKWDEEGFYYIMNPTSNEIYLKALELFDEAARLAAVY